MASESAEAIGIERQAASLAELADRWIYVVVGTLFLATVLVGFIPTSIEKLDAVAAGARPPLPGFMHFHAVMMGSWIMLLLAQSALVAQGNRAVHMRLGIVSVFLIPAVVISMVGVAGANFTQLAAVAPDLMPEDLLGRRRVGVSNTMLAQIRMVLLFPVLAFWAVLVRKEDSETHKRLMFVATLPLLSAAIDRIDWLRTFLPGQPLFMDVTQLAWLSPLLIYDVWRRGRLHKAYVIGIAVNLPFIVFTHIAWGTDWWLAAAPKVFGIQSW